MQKGEKEGQPFVSSIRMILSAIILDYYSEVIVDDVSYGAWVILQTADHCLMMLGMTNDVRNQLHFSSGFIGATPKW